MNIENKVDEYLEHYNHNHDALGRFTFSGAISSAVSSYRRAKSKRLAERTEKDKDKLAYQKIKSKARQARVKLKAEKKISKSKEKLIRAKGKAKSDEYLRKARNEKGASKAEKTFDKTLDIKGKTAEERNRNREQLRRDKSAEIKEAIESGSVVKLSKYKDLMTTNEINTAVNRINADNSVKNLQVKKIDSMIGKAEKAINTVDRVMQAKQKVDRWVQDSENKEKRATEAEKKAERQKKILELYEKATKGDTTAIDKLEDIAAQRDIDNDNVNKVIERANKISKRKKVKHTALAHYNHNHDPHTGRFTTSGTGSISVTNGSIKSKNKISEKDIQAIISMKAGDRSNRKEVSFGNERPKLGFGSSSKGNKPSPQQIDTFLKLIADNKKIHAQTKPEAINNLYDPYKKYGFGDKSKEEFSKGVKLDEILIVDKKADYDPDFPDPDDILEYDTVLWYTHPEYGDWMIEYDSKKRKIYNQEYFR